MEKKHSVKMFYIVRKTKYEEMFHFVKPEIIPINICYYIEKLWNTIYSVEMFYIVRKAKHEQMFHFFKPEIISINIWYYIKY